MLADLVDYLDRRDLPRPGREPYLERVDGLRILPYLAIIRRKLPDVPINDAIRGSDRGSTPSCATASCGRSSATPACSS